MIHGKDRDGQTDEDMNSVAAAVGPACVAVLRNLAAVFIVAKLSATAAAWAQTTSTSSGQAYPSGSMRIVVPFPPGGGTDILARSLAQKLNEAWGVSVIVDNRGGANGTIGAAAVAKAPPDGHTLLVVPSGFAVNPSIYKSLPFDATKDFAPVSQLASSPLVLVVHPSFPPRSVKELIAFLKARPDEINYGSSGNGSPPHLATELFKLLTGTKMTHIPYKSPPGVRAYWFNVHKSIGITIAVLVLVRIAWRLAHRPPALPSTMAAWQRIGAKISHYALYGCMIVMPVSGYLGSSFTKYPIKYFGHTLPHWGWDSPALKELMSQIHFVTAFIFVTLIVLHIAAALKHRFVDRDGVFERMFPLFTKRPQHSSVPASVL